MRISSRIHYGLQFMLSLGVQYNNASAVVRVKEVARKENLSEKYLEQIATLLKSAGLIRSTRGAQGGYSLTREPASISVKEIVESLEGSSRLPAAPNRAALEDAGTWVIANLWNKFNDHVADFLGRTSLKDLVESHNKTASVPMFYI